MCETPDVLAIIPARAGSKRLPDKNIRDFHGKPLISWTIEAAIDCPVVQRVLISTNDDTTLIKSR